MVAVGRGVVCLAGVAVLAVSLKFGLYEYFHGDSGVLRSLLDLL